MKKHSNPSPAAARQLVEVGERIQLARLRRGISLRSVAQRAGVSVNTVMALESGSAGVGFGTVGTVLHTLGLVSDLGLLAKDDVLGRKLQDIGLKTKKRAPKVKRSVGSPTKVPEEGGSADEN
jgi:transcriptional regulator with XRE-family HTH domain